jgi:hypothetical protein
MFLTNAKMKLLFQSALYKAKLGSFLRNVKRFIMHYGGNLEKEASEELQKQAAKYIRHSAQQVTIHIKRAMILEVRIDRLSKAKHVNNWLESLQESKNLPFQTLEAESEDQIPFSRTDPDEEDVDDLSWQTLYMLQAFMTTAKAFEKLQIEFRQWLRTRKRKRLAIRRKQTPDIHCICPVQDQSDITRSEDEEGPSNCSYLGEYIPPSTIKIRTNFMQKFVFKIVPLLWPKPSKGYKRIAWLSALGKPLYIDLKEIVQGAADGLQERFGSSAFKKASSSSQPSSGTSVCLGPISTPPPVHLRVDTNNSPIIDASENPTEGTDVSGLDAPPPPINCIRDVYLEIQTEESCYMNIPFINSVRLPGWILWLLGDLHFFTPKEVKFISVRSVLDVTQFPLTYMNMITV